MYTYIYIHIWVNQNDLTATGIIVRSMKGNQ